MSNPDLEEYYQRVCDFVKDHQREFSVVAIDKFWLRMDENRSDIPPMVREGFKAGYYPCDTGRAWMLELAIY